MTEVFLDTAYAIALSAPGDEHHQRAVLLAQQMEADRTRLVTTRAVLFEIGNALAKSRYRKAAVQLLDSLEQDPNVEIIPVSEQLYRRAFQLYRDRLDNGVEHHGLRFVYCDAGSRTDGGTHDRRSLPTSGLSSLAAEKVLRKLTRASIRPVQIAQRRVFADDNGVLNFGALPNYEVIGNVQPQVENMQRFMASFHNPWRQRRRQLSVDEELQDSCSTAWSACFAA